MNFYRKCVGITVFNPSGKIWVGERSNVCSEKKWQMPQGGVDSGEKTLNAASRELYEETGIKSVQLIKESSNWIKYDFPSEVFLKKKIRGQEQKWYLFFFKGKDLEVNLNLMHNPEFSSWKWDTIENTIQNVIEFKKLVYEEIFKEFYPFINKQIKNL